MGDAIGLPVLWAYDVTEQIGVCTDHEELKPGESVATLEFNDRGKELLATAVNAGTISIHQTDRAFILYIHLRPSMDMDPPPDCMGLPDVCSGDNDEGER